MCLHDICFEWTFSLSDMNKPKVIKDFSKLDESLQDEILEKYPKGYQDYLILFTDKEGKYAYALPYETEDKYFLLRMPPLKASKADNDDSEDDADDDDYNDLDTMQVGGNSNKDDDDEYD